MNMKTSVLAMVVGVVCYQGHAAYVGIHAAAASGDLAALKRYLAEDPSLITSRNGPGRTPLCIATMRGQTGAVEFLISRGADVNDKGFEEMTPLADMAAYGTRDDERCAEIAAILLAHGARVDPVDSYKDTPLLHAVEFKKSRLARVLLEHGASMKPTYTGANSGMTAMHMAIHDNDKEMVKVLLEFNAPLDVPDREGATPLLLAEQLDRTEIAAMLRDAAHPGTKAKIVAVSVPPTRDAMRVIARRIAQGDATAFEDLRKTAEDLYRGIDCRKEHARILLNLDRMMAAYKLLGEEAGKGNDLAFQALKKSLGTHMLHPFAASGLGIAAAGGQKEALEILLHNDQWGIDDFSANAALCLPAQKNIEPAVDHFVEWLGSDKPFRTGVSEVMSATNALASAAALGNPEAKVALERFTASHPAPTEESRR